MRFIVQNHSWTPPDVGPRAAILGLDNWDDFGFRTSFDLWFRPAENTSPIGIGRVKIALADQPTGPSPVPEGDFPDGLPTTGSPWISVGQDALYYEALTGFGQAGQEILRGLGDVTTTEDASHLERELRNLEQSSEVFRTSLLRNISLNTVLQQWRRIATGGPRQTQYWFSYHLPQTPGEIVHPPLEFEVRPSSVPSSNIHVLIGPNGVGKTTLLRSLATAAVAPTPVPMPAEGRIAYNNDVGFANVLLVTFSAFDPFIGVHPGREVKFQHVGLTAYRDSGEPGDAHSSRLKEREELAGEFIDSLRSIATSGHYDQWVTTLFILGSDRQFRDAVIGDDEDTPIPDRPIGLLKGDGNELTNGAGRSWRATFMDLSSGHALVLLTVTRLVDLVAERTLVLIDEPEAHLHPPLLSSFVRALSELLSARNGVAITATHSPVVLQEVPKSCAYKIRRSRGRARRPRIETYGENVGVLTHEIFGLEVKKSGFYAELEKAVEQFDSYEDILRFFDHQLGDEAKGLVHVLLADKWAESR
ncbi:AAA family ATPase [Streptomyces rubiginosohelvolus]|uniref:AAA family ATPase n=1 Tax=Streptomyces rubiginosohelvolus TaxID=67362 RepID=UPI0034311385